MSIKISLTFPLRFAAAGDPRAPRRVAHPPPAGHAAWLRARRPQVLVLARLFLASDGSGTIPHAADEGTAARNTGCGGG